MKIVEYPKHFQRQLVREHSKWEKCPPRPPKGKSTKGKVRATNSRANAASKRFGSSKLKSTGRSTKESKSKGTPGTNYYQSPFSLV
jgi:hypothetical protein